MSNPLTILNKIVLTIDQYHLGLYGLGGEIKGHDDNAIAIFHYSSGQTCTATTPGMIWIRAGNKATMNFRLHLCSHIFTLDIFVS